MLDFLGTFNRSQFQRLLEQARANTAYIPTRQAHLKAEILRMGYLTFVYDTAGNPTAYNTGEPGMRTYIGRLMEAYEILGGNPFFDLQTRGVNNPVSYRKGTHEATAKVLTNGDVLGQAGLSDGPSGNAVRKIRAGFIGHIQALEKLERKVRRTLDYVDQLKTELVVLDRVRAAVTVEGSLEDLAKKVEGLFHDPSYRALVDDAGSDPHGKLTYAPFGSYDNGPKRTPPPGVTFQR